MKATYRRFRNGYGCNLLTFRLGQDYTIPKMRWCDGKWRRTKLVVRFIKTTRKGFNLLDLATNKCILSQTRLYDRKWSGKDIPKDVQTFTVQLPAYISIPVENELS